MSENEECAWKYNEWHVCWDTSCGNEWCLDDEDIEDNGLHFCPSCGRRIVVEGDE